MLTEPVLLIIAGLVFAGLFRLKMVPEVERKLPRRVVCDVGAIIYALAIDTRVVYFSSNSCKLTPCSDYDIAYKALFTAAVKFGHLPVFFLENKWTMQFLP